MDGSCLASPRWVSLLVAELFYPHARFPGTKPGKLLRLAIVKTLDDVIYLIRNNLPFNDEREKSEPETA